MKTTRIYKDIIKAYVGGSRRILLEGGQSSSKTYSALQALIYIAQEAPGSLLISIVSESLPHLKRGAVRDFFDILGESQDHNPYFNKTEAIYKRPEWNGTIEFFGADDAGKVRGPRRQILYINEGNNVPWATADGLDSRTSMFTIVDWNPVSEFWAHDYWKGDSKNAYSHSTYLDARGVLPAETVATIEEHKDRDPNWWNIYGLGLLGKVGGLVHPYFKQVDELPDGEYFYGLDFGFGAYNPNELVGGDPTVLVKNVLIGDDLYSREMFYNREAMTNDDIAREMDLLRVGSAPIYPDPNEPKSAEEIRNNSFNIRETVRGAGSVKFGIRKVNSYYQYWTKDSLDCIKDQRNYTYIKRKEGGSGREYISDDTTHQWSHGMDARRYAIASQMGERVKPITKHSSFRF